MLASKRNFLFLIAFLGVLAISLELSGSVTGYAIAKASTTIAIILYAASNRGISRMSAQVVSALVFCLLGDIALVWDEFFLLGIGFFLIAHLLFIRALRNRFGSRFVPIAVLFSMVVLIGITTLLWNGLNGILKIAVPIYALVISIMVALALSVALKRRTTMRLQIALGALLFMISDTLLGIDGFLTPLPFASILILSTYWTALTFLANAGREF